MQNVSKNSSPKNLSPSHSSSVKKPLLTKNPSSFSLFPASPSKISHFFAVSFQNSDFHTHLKPYSPPVEVSKKTNMYFLIRNGVEFEKDDENDDKNSQLFLEKTARNFLRFLIQGNVVGNDEIKKQMLIIRKSLDKKKDENLLNCIRIEMKNVLNNCCLLLEDLNIKKDPIEGLKLEIFIDNLLAAYPFMNPPTTEPNCEKIIIPQKIGNIWIKIEYKFGKIDLSPKKGDFAKSLRAEDKMYAYTLEPMQIISDFEFNMNLDLDSFEIYILFMGSTYPTGQGQVLCDIGKFESGYSVGERFLEEEDFLSFMEYAKRNNRKIKVTGHSMGASMAIVTAIKWPSLISHATALNPSALCKETLNRYLKKWQSTLSRSILVIVLQDRDPVVECGDAFPEEKENNINQSLYIYKLRNPNRQYSPLTNIIPSFFSRIIPLFVTRWFQDHLQFLVGQEETEIHLIKNPKSLNYTRMRDFISTLKKVKDFFCLWNKANVTISRFPELVKNVSTAHKFRVVLFWGPFYLIYLFTQTLPAKINSHLATKIIFFPITTILFFIDFILSLPKKISFISIFTVTLIYTSIKILFKSLFNPVFKFYPTEKIYSTKLTNKSYI